jgi:hypothetical protein
MSHEKSREVILSVKVTPELVKALDALRSTWRQDPHSIPGGLACSESKAEQFVLIANESVFTTIPGACIIKGIGALELANSDHLFEDGATSKTLVLRDTPEGWRFSVKYMPPIVRERNTR